jgi:hypothetical protein
MNLADGVLLLLLHAEHRFHTGIELADELTRRLGASRINAARDVRTSVQQAR